MSENARLIDHTTPAAQITLDSLLRLEWSATDEQEVEEIRKRVEPLGATEFGVYHPLPSGTVTFVVPLRTAITFYAGSITSIVEWYLAPDAEERIRALLADPAGVSGASEE